MARQNQPGPGKAGSTRPPAVFVIYGDEEFAKSRALQETLDALLPAEVDRSLALSEYDGTRAEDQGGPALAAVMDDLGTLPFLADRRVVLIREADKFISAHRDRLEAYVQSPSPTGVLILECRSFPANTRLAKFVRAGGGRAIECKKLSGGGLLTFVRDEAKARGKRVAEDVAARLVELIGNDQGALAGEIEKLSLYTGDRPQITHDDVTALVGLSREERVFAAMDAAAGGRLEQALALWRQVLELDPSAEYKAVGGVAYKLRQWMQAHELREAGVPIGAIAPKVGMWGRPRELESLLRRLSPRDVRRLHAELAELDAKAKLGLRSIETGVQALLAKIARARPPAVAAYSSSRR